MAYSSPKMEMEVKEFLEKDEKIMLMLRESLWSDFAPSVVVATNKRIIIVNKSFWGTYANQNIFTPTDYNSVYYNQITSVIIVKGKFFSSLNIRLHGWFEQSVGTQRAREGQVDGLNKEDALKLYRFIDAMLRDEKGEDELKVADPDVSSNVHHVFEDILHGKGTSIKEITTKDAIDIVNKDDSDKYIWLSKDSGKKWILMKVD